MPNILLITSDQQHRNTIGVRCICQPTMGTAEWGSTPCALFATGAGTGALTGVSVGSDA